MQLCGPASGSPGEGVVLDELVEQVDPLHVPVIVADDCRALHSYLFVVYSALSSCLLPLDNFFLHGLVAGGYHRHEPDPLPADDKHICFPTPHGVSSCKLPRVLSEPLEDSGCPTHQTKGTTAMDTCIVQFLGQGYRVIVVVHKQVVSLVSETIYKPKDSVTKSGEYPGVN